MSEGSPCACARALKDLVQASSDEKNILLQEPPARKKTALLLHQTSLQF